MNDHGTTMLSRRRARSMTAVLAAAAVAAGAGAAHPPHDDVTGRDLLTYPRHPQADVESMRLNIMIPDMNVRRMEVVQDLTFASVQEDFTRLKLDAKLMTIRGVECADRAVSYEHDGQELVLTFDPPLDVGEKCTITTTYSFTGAPYGIHWTPETPAMPGRPAQLHSKGQPEFNSYWFPCHDFPNDRFTSEIIATVPSAFDVVSNGRLVSVQNKAIPVREGDGGALSRLGMYRRFHWAQAQPHVSYLVTFAVGKWDVRDVGTRALPMPVYAPLGHGSEIEFNCGRTAEMVKVLERVFDQPYPWEKYAQVYVHNYITGATENTSATTLSDYAYIPAAAALDHDPDGLVMHELAHQWFGNLVTCRSWEHIWINEALATYAEALWFQERDGPIGYEAEIFREMVSAFGSDTGTAPDKPGMVSKHYRIPRDVFTKGASPYSKGSAILHMLRQRVGDAAFFRGIALILDRFAYNQAETSDVLAVFEEVSGEALDQFFRQWCERPGYPRLDVTIGWDGSSSRAAIDVLQTQVIDGANPAYEFDLPVVARLKDGSDHAAVVEVRGREARLNVDLPSEPRWIAVDPRMTVLGAYSVTSPAGWLHDQARNGPSIAARVQAIEALAAAGDEGTPSLCEIIAFSPGQHELVKLAAVRAAKKLGSTGVLETCVSGRPPQWAVREAAVGALAEAVAARTDDGAARAKERAVRMILELYHKDPSVKVRAASIRALGTLKAFDQLPLVLAAAQTPSPLDRVRHGALRALGDLDAPEALPVVVLYTGEGAIDRTRQTALEVLPKLARHDPDLAYETVAAIVRNGPERTRRAAGKALVELKDPRGSALLEEQIAASRDAAEKLMLGDWLDELREHLDEPATDDDAGMK
ncbi:MAG: HEAT repeat domain-containing protein [Phycisphaerales bacterium]|nr:HEAT repeat domain-containing protein [Phycisphaerales bacterium]